MKFDWPLAAVRLVIITAGGKAMECAGSVHARHTSSVSSQGNDTKIVTLLMLDDDDFDFIKSMKRGPVEFRASAWIFRAKRVGIECVPWLTRNVLENMAKMVCDGVDDGLGDRSNTPRL